MSIDLESRVHHAFAESVPPLTTPEAALNRWMREAPSLRDEVETELSPRRAPEERWAAAHRQIAQSINGHALPISMPLRSNVSSNLAPNAPFFRGPGTVVMHGSFITDDTEIGAYSYLGFNCMVSGARIGRYVSIANRVTIGPGEHRLDDISTNSLFYDDPLAVLTALPCVIEHDAWIAENVTVRRGVTIGIGAVIGANSFVNADVPPFAIAAGSPARVIRMRFDLPTIDAILASGWWEKDVDEARRIVSALRTSLLGSPAATPPEE